MSCRLAADVGVLSTTFLAGPSTVSLRRPVVLLFHSELDSPSSQLDKCFDVSYDVPCGSCGVRSSLSRRASVLPLETSPLKQQASTVTAEQYKSTSPGLSGNHGETLFQPKAHRTTGCKQLTRHRGGLAVAGSTT